ARRERRWRAGVCRRVRWCGRTSYRVARLHRPRPPLPQRILRMSRRSRHLDVVAMTYSKYALPLQWSIEYSRPLHEGDHVEEDDQRPKCKRNRDRPRPSTALLFFAEDDFARLFVHVFTTTLALPQPARRSVAPRTARIDRESRNRKDDVPLARRMRLRGFYGHAART